MKNRDQNQRQNQFELEKQKALNWLRELGAKTPLKPYLLNCLVCGKDSEGKIRCKKHQQEYGDVFFDSTEKFLAIFKDQM